MKESVLHLIVVVVMIVAALVLIQNYAMPAFTDALRERLENAANAR